jgi:hypothetical protein
MNKKLIIALVIIIFVGLGLGLGLGFGLKSGGSNNSRGSNTSSSSKILNTPTIPIWDPTMCKNYYAECKKNISLYNLPNSSLDGCIQMMIAHQCDKSSYQ